MSWSYSKISFDWKASTAMAPNGENIVVFAYHVWEVNSDGIYNQVGSDWPNTVAATTNGNFIYAIRPDGFIYKLRTSNYTVSKWIDAGGGWEKAKAIFSYNDLIYVILDAIWEIRLDGTYKKVQSENWSNTRSITVIGDYAYLVLENGNIYKLDLRNWTYRVLSSGWSNTFLLLTLDNKLFVYDISLTMVDTDTGETTIVYSDNWNKILAGCATSSTMYAVFDSGNLWKVTKS
ncbi:19102_t:CDS:1 [Dentiscutata erythropus]|uniref:19102_t:CDS:1 n=1 Tax=Dentiscutata erythropus TaxID=1348616 RepID=A0A9N9IML1_9GLOM|nr:19102_t:CDS:1 [Dentiscutata erythropus]